jgi:hypothetical protein
MNMQLKSFFLSFFDTLNPKIIRAFKFKSEEYDSYELRENKL